MVPSDARAGEETMKEPVVYSHFLVPAELSAVNFPSHEPK